MRERVFADPIVITSGNTKMFMPPKHWITFFAALLAIIGTLDSPTAEAQSGSRYEALQRAQARSASSTRSTRSASPDYRPPSARPLSATPTRAVSPVPRGRQNRPPQAASRVARFAGSRPVMNGGPILQDEQLIVDDGYVTDEYIGGDGGCDSCGTPAGAGGCASCLGDSFFGAQGACDGRGGCPPGTLDQCWLGMLGPFLRAGEYGIGVQGFRGPLYTINTGDGNINIDDASFGFYGQANYGVPLCKLSCGLLSGQIGVRNVITEFNGNPFSSDNRNQLFFTAGIFRRVDYGWQMGIVADILHEEWYTSTDLVQVRGDLAWVYGGGGTLGFRFAAGTQTDTTQGIIVDANGRPTNFTGLFNEVIDNYRFYYQTNYAGGGYSELALGWTEDHAVLAVDFDIPMTEHTALQTGFTYFLPGDKTQRTQFGGNANDAWNIYLGCVYRPKGRNWYRNYDRPLFNVADNGSMVIRRQ